MFVAGLVQKVCPSRECARTICVHMGTNVCWMGRKIAQAPCVLAKKIAQIFDRCIDGIYDLLFPVQYPYAFRGNPLFNKDILSLRAENRQLQWFKTNHEKTIQAETSQLEKIQEQCDTITLLQINLDAKTTDFNNVSAQLQAIAPSLQQLTEKNQALETERETLLKNQLQLLAQVGEKQRINTSLSEQVQECRRRLTEFETDETYTKALATIQDLQNEVDVLNEFARTNHELYGTVRQNIALEKKQRASILPETNAFAALKTLVNEPVPQPKDGILPAKYTETLSKASKALMQSQATSEVLSAEYKEFMEMDETLLPRIAQEIKKREAQYSGKSPLDTLASLTNPSYAEMTRKEQP